MRNKSPFSVSLSNSSFELRPPAFRISYLHRMPQRRYIRPQFSQSERNRYFFQIRQDHKRHHHTKDPARSVGEKYQYRRSYKHSTRFGPPRVIAGQPFEPQESDNRRREIAPDSCRKPCLLLCDHLWPQPPSAQRQRQVSKEIAPTIQLRAQFGRKVQSPRYQSVK